jgi:non-homologous end joining protein Ku
LLEQKAKGGPLPEPKAEEGGEVIDLMEALRQSVAATQKKRAPTKKKTSTARKRVASRKAS